MLTAVLRDGKNEQNSFFLQENYNNTKCSITKWQLSLSSKILYTP